MTVKKICEEILSVNHLLFDQIYTEKIEDLYSDLVFRGKNEELNNSLELHEPSRTYYTPRKTPLNGTELIEGENFICDFDGHRPEISLDHYETQMEIEELLLSDGSVLNLYCTFAIPILNGKARLYTIEYFNTINKKIEQLNLKEFKKNQLEGVDGVVDMDEMIKRKIIWL